jgi:4'-phosphopantetheinyl transferase EntD
MPLHVIEKVHGSRSMAIFQITENSSELLEELAPDSKDLELLSTFTNDQKKKEWLAGRLTLRFLARVHDLTYYGIRKDDFGKPYLRNHSVEVSLSHSYPYVAAILDTSVSVGIDLEQPKDKLIRVAPRFLSERELDQTGNDLRKLCILWCAKEALYKIYSQRGLIFREHLFIDPFDLKKEGDLRGSIRINGKQHDYTLKYEDREDFLLVFNK